MRGALTHCIGVVEWVTAGLTSAPNDAFLALNAFRHLPKSRRDGDVGKWSLVETGALILALIASFPSVRQPCSAATEWRSSPV
jgi:hypothetical protein